MLKIYNTYSRSLEIFQSIKPHKVGFYACGPTVYDEAHIGNFRTYISQDLFRRVLEHLDYVVTHVVNITDVGHLTDDEDQGEDKMEKGARRLGKSVWEVSKEYLDIFQKDWRSLDLLEPTIWCKATDYIQEQIEVIQAIESKGWSYQTKDGIYFDTKKCPDYGSMSGLKIKDILAGARVDMGEKRSSTDFALWKFSPESPKRQMEWPSPWGVGFPGWHIECTAMSSKYLGHYFDLHGGGQDHIPIHHTNEIAQSQGAFGTSLAKYWIHTCFLNLKNEKMSKSLGNMITLRTIKDKGFTPQEFKWFCLQAHYRKELIFSWESLKSAQISLQRLKPFMGQDLKEYPKEDLDLKEFIQHLSEDFHTPKALAVLWKVIDKPNAQICIPAMLKILGITQQTSHSQQVIEVSSEIKEQCRLRLEAKLHKNWKESDRLRDDLMSQGYEVSDITFPHFVLKKEGTIVWSTEEYDQSSS